jgi:elongation factor 2
MLNVSQKEVMAIIEGEISAAETFDLSETLRGATAGRAFWGLEFSHWAPVPGSMINQVIADIRKRKGLPPERLADTGACPPYAHIRAVAMFLYLSYSIEAS